MPESLTYSNITAYQANKTEYWYQMLTNQAVNLYIDNGYDMVNSIKMYGPSVLKGNSTL